MRMTKLNLLIACLLLLAGLAAAWSVYFSTVREQQPAYLELPKPATPASAGKIEVIEFFWYGCPHCYKYNDVLDAWVAKHADRITLRRVPFAVRDKQIPQQKMYYAFDALGKLDDMHALIFEKIHLGHKPLNTDDSISVFAQEQRISKEQWQAAYQSPQVQEKIQEADRLQHDYKVERVPSVVIGGRYLTSPGMAGMKLPYWGQTDEMRYSAAEKIMDELLARVEQEGRLR
ncbi:thiol:disulfide interchange protein DsbA/DsbL [Janthinobacterium agaricidamnosum]|uniref:Thiol:disulfide interchange protein DsbA n=1 Tax=Janthinobacterium agaricidamnosum NBRC 102515 = DSM 9628 TaxID=1349767 RepID=W0VAT5_9BURK|nr:thiol:disulfide interchange protein DsbA/DsbL [Janthinobacterium agaricidamnosum]CDG85924.1 DSBA-like thioredoxin domain protein [Janthinobacterium agaricidamnosum NBRC 102515 = DSM 9628]